MSQAIVREELEQHGLAIVIAGIEVIDCRSGVGLFTVSPAVSAEKAQLIVTESRHDLAMRTVVGPAPGAEEVSAKTAAADDIAGVRRPHGNDAADRRTAVQGRCRSVKHLDVLNQAGIDKVSRGVRETAGVELVGKGYAIDKHRNPVAANASYIDAFGPEARAGRFVIDAGHIAKDIADRRGKLRVQLRA